MDIETRSYPLTEIRVKRDGDKPVIEGHASVFNSMSENLGGFYEIVKPGFFDDMMDDDVRALINHDPSLIIGRTKAGTMSISQDDEGLFNRITPPDTSYANDLLVSMERGDVDQQSFQFVMPADGSGEKWYIDDEGRTIRELVKGKKLLDTSIVTFPAYPAAKSVSKRAIDFAQQFRIQEDAPADDLEAQESEREREIELMAEEDL
jgi:hypothetical protein